MTASFSTPRLSGHHVAGLVVGEGCFYAESQPDPKYRLGWRIRPGFCIEMRADEREVLEQVQRELGCGAIYDLDFGRYRGYENKNWQPHAKFRVRASSTSTPTWCRSSETMSSSDGSASPSGSSLSWSRCCIGARIENPKVFLRHEILPRRYEPTTRGDA